VSDPSLDHNDLHGGNVFLGGPGQGPRLFDWDDAVVSHPFASAVVLRSVVRWVLGVDDETPAERRILDAYLEPFGALAPRAELREVVDLACEVGKVARSLVWARAVALLPADEPDPDGFRTAPLDWLLELLEGPLA
jgi:Ser/Thr protein kinase RdoA (MazF antagonist)